MLAHAGAMKAAFTELTVCSPLLLPSRQFQVARPKTVDSLGAGNGDGRRLQRPRAGQPEAAAQ